MNIHNIMNIDTVAFSVRGQQFKIPNSRLVTYSTSAGEADWKGTNRVSVPGAHKVHDLSLRALDSFRKLTVEGSLGGFLHGQNVFTSSNLEQLCTASIKRLIEMGAVNDTTELRQACKG